MQVAEATLKKANNKIAETESIESLLRKGGVCLGFRAGQHAHRVSYSLSCTPLGGTMLFTPSKWGLDLRGAAMITAAMQDLEPYIVALKNTKYDLKQATDKPAGTISDEELNRIKDDMLSAITSYDDQVKIAKRSIPKTTKPKAKAKAAA